MRYLIIAVLAVFTGLGVMKFSNTIPTSLYSVDIVKVPQLSWKDIGMTDKDIAYMGFDKKGNIIKK